MALEFSVDQDPASFGNHFIVGLHGTTLSDSDKRVLAGIRPAGILLLKRNLDHELPYPEWTWKLKALLDEVRSITEREELLISIDHEGRRVTRTPPPITIFPNAAFLREQSVLVARAQAIELRSLGINVSWAPVADIHSNPANPIIGERAFGTTADDVCKFAVPYMKTLMEQGLLTCAKHFPGHGDTSTDSHLELPRVDLTEQELLDRELVPFMALVQARVPLVMTAHIIYPKIDSQFPATMSEKIIKGILRSKLGFNGVVVTDDLDMKAISEDFNKQNMVARALTVGCDMFIIARHPGAMEDRAIVLAENIASALRDRTLSEDTLFNAFCRINYMFEELLPYNEPHVLDKKVFEEHQALADSIKSSGAA